MLMGDDNIIIPPGLGLWRWDSEGLDWMRRSFFMSTDRYIIILATGCAAPHHRFGYRSFHSGTGVAQCPPKAQQRWRRPVLRRCCVTMTMDLRSFASGDVRTSKRSSSIILYQQLPYHRRVVHQYHQMRLIFLRWRHFHSSGCAGYRKEDLSSELSNQLKSS